MYLKRYLAITTIILPLACVAASAQVDEAEIENMVSTMLGFMVAEREVMIGDELQLSDAEANGFWPVYENYRAEIGVIQDRYGQLIVDFTANHDALTDSMAERFIDEYFAVLTEINEIRQEYVAQFREVIPIEKLARLYQMENKIDAIAQLPLIMDVPLAELPASRD